VGAPGPVPMWPMPKSWPEITSHETGEQGVDGNRPIAAMSARTQYYMYTDKLDNLKKKISVKRL
jgi:hypothetical protein